MNAMRNALVLAAAGLALLGGLAACSAQNNPFVPTGVYAEPYRTREVIVQEGPVVEPPAYDQPSYPVPAQPFSDSYASQPQVVTQLNDSQLEQILGPVALYPDPLLAQVLPAATFGQDVAEAAQWLRANPQFDESVLAQLPWDDSVKALGLPVTYVDADGNRI